MQFIVYLDNEHIRVIYPSPDWPYGMDLLAKKDVPAGMPYKFILNSSIDKNLPIDNWNIDMSNPDGTGSFDFGSGSDWSITEYAEINGEISILVKNQNTGETKILNI